MSQLQGSGVNHTLYSHGSRYSWIKQLCWQKIQLLFICFGLSHFFPLSRQKNRICPLDPSRSVRWSDLQLNCSAQAPSMAQWGEMGTFGVWLVRSVWISALGQGESHTVGSTASESGFGWPAQTCMSPWDWRNPTHHVPYLSCKDNFWFEFPKVFCFVLWLFFFLNCLHSIINCLVKYWIQIASHSCLLNCTVSLWWFIFPGILILTLRMPKQPSFYRKKKYLKGSFWHLGFFPCRSFLWRFLEFSPISKLNKLHSLVCGLLYLSLAFWGSENTWSWSIAQFTEELKYVSNTPCTFQSPCHFSYQPQWVLNSPLQNPMRRFNKTLGITSEKAEQNLLCRVFQARSIQAQCSNPNCISVFLMARPIVPYTMLLAISAISSGLFCFLFKVILILLVEFQSISPFKSGIQQSIWDNF